MKHVMTMTLAEKIMGEVHKMLDVGQVNEEGIGTVKAVTFSSLGDLRNTRLGHAIEFVSDDVKISRHGFFGAAFESVSAKVQVFTRCDETAYGDFFAVIVSLNWRHRDGGTNGHRLDMFWHASDHKLMTRAEVADMSRTVDC